jgi:hypothetical protein
MITIRANDEQKVVALLHSALADQEVELFQSDESEEVTIETILASLAYNARKTREYVGRLVREENHIEAELHQLNLYLEPLATYATHLLAETELSQEELIEQRRLRENRVYGTLLRKPKEIRGVRN